MLSQIRSMIPLAMVGDNRASRLAGHIYLVTNSRTDDEYEVWAEDAEVAAEKIAARLYGHDVIVIRESGRRGDEGTFQVFKARPERLGGGLVPFGDHLRVAC